MVLTFLILIAVSGVAALAALVWLVRALVADTAEDVSSQGPKRRRRSLIRRALGWLTDRPKRLSYRRDSRGRFRRIWRG